MNLYFEMGKDGINSVEDILQKLRGELLHKNVGGVSVTYYPTVPKGYLYPPILDSGLKDGIIKSTMIEISDGYSKKKYQVENIAFFMKFTMNNPMTSDNALEGYEFLCKVVERGLQAGLLLPFFLAEPRMAPLAKTDLSEPMLYFCFVVSKVSREELNKFFMDEFGYELASKEGHIGPLVTL